MLHDLVGDVKTGDYTDTERRLLGRDQPANTQSRRS